MLVLELRWRYLTTGVEKRCFFLIFWPPAGQHSPGRNVGEKGRFFEKKKPPAGQHSPGRNVFIHRCIHMYAYCIHIDDNCIEMFKNVAMLLNLMFLILRMMVSDFFSDN